MQIHFLLQYGIVAYLFIETFLTICITCVTCFCIDGVILSKIGMYMKDRKETVFLICQKLLEMP